MSESQFLRVALIVALLVSPVAVPAALAQDSAEAIEEVVVVGSRRAGRTATDSPVPVDVVSGTDFENQGTSDMDDLLRNLLPSYNVTSQSISDAATLTRPANLRGLPPDNTLILINGKRHRRSSVIAELGGSLAAGSQGPDLAVIPTLAIERVEVLRDGAAAQYGSDAIAGVINFALKENREGFTIDGRYGEYYEGDGALKQLGANLGLPLGPDGFANLSLQYRDVEASSRSLPRTDAQALIDTGNDDVVQPAQIWGQPEIEDDWAFFVNSGINLTDSQELYAFGNYAERKVTGGFFYRNPNARPGVFSDSFSGGTRAIADLDFPGEGTQGYVSNCPALASPGSTPTDQAAVDADRAALAGLPDNCWVANNLYPGGYTPAFGGDITDIGGVLGVRGEMDSGLSYDVSASLGRNQSAYRIGNTWNPSLGPESTTSFNLGKYTQTEQNYNADFVYPVAVDAFYSDLNVAFGAEYRVETFAIDIGDIQSWDAGDNAFLGGIPTLDVDNDGVNACAPGVPGDGCNYFSDGTTPMVGFSVGAHGFAGFSPVQQGQWSRSNWAIYTDLEADVVESVTLGFALRYEDFQDFGDTLNGKIAGRWALTDTFAIRGSFSTGFRAPTPGQSNVTKVSTVTVDGELQQRGQIPPTNPIAQLLGAEPLKEEEATNFTVGAAWDATDNLTLTLDYFNIQLEDRISQTGTIDITNTLAPTGVGCDGLFIPDCAAQLGFSSAADLSAVSFFTNDFETTTQGIDLVGTYITDWGNAGITNWSLAWNWTDTTVDDAGEEVSRNRLVDLENFNPENRVVFTANHLIGDFRFLFRMNWYDDWTVGDYSGDPTYVAGGTNYTIDCDNDDCYKGEFVFDLEAAYTFNERYTVVVGGQNVFDQDGADDANNSAPAGFSNNSGQAFAQSTPWGINGGFWYLRFRADF
jgi:iron complex outermembrane receptor protein